MKRIIGIVTLVLMVAFIGLAYAQSQGYIVFRQGAKELTVKSGGTIAVESGGIFNVESGGYLKVAGTAVTGSAAELNYLDGTTLGTSVASKILGLGASRNTNFLAITDTLSVLGASTMRPAHLSDLSDSCFIFKLVSGVPVIDLFGTDDDTWRLTIDTNDTAILSGATGGFDLSSGVITMENDETISNATNGDIILSGNVLGPVKAIAITADDTLTAAEMNGQFYYARPLAAKATVLLPAAAANLHAKFMVADADSLLLTTATGDSLIATAGTAWKTTSSVTGVVEVIGIDTTRFIVLETAGTWTPY